jgi:hypothetical protein
MTRARQNKSGLEGRCLSLASRKKLPMRYTIQPIETRRTVLSHSDSCIRPPVLVQLDVYKGIDCHTATVFRAVP